MKKYFKAISLIPLFLLGLACASGNADNLSGTSDDQNTTPPPITVVPVPLKPLTPASPSSQVAFHPVAPENIFQVSPTFLLQTAFENHASRIYDGWSVTSSEDQAKVTEMVKKAWEDYLGYADLNAFQAALKADSLNTLNKFLQFQVHTILSASDLYRAKNNQDTVVASLLNQMGDRNLSALNHLQGAFASLPTAGNMPELQAFGGELEANDEFNPKVGDLYNISLAAAELRIFLVAVADCYNSKDYFTDVNGTDAKFKTLEDAFLIAPDDLYHWTLPDFIGKKFVDLDIYPYNSDVCYYNPGCKVYKGNGWAIVTYLYDALPEMLERVSFTYTDDQGKKHYWSFFNFENVYVNGQMFTLARGRFGANETKNVIFVKESEFSK